jgi:poly-gamma-glutamate synthesis protein (capsule biosynthesis protein)
MLTFKQGIETFRESVSESHLSITITGDVCPWQDAVETVKAGNSIEILEAIKPQLDAADISIIQWETPLTDAETPIAKSGPNLKCPPECVDFAKTGGFDVALLANNHIGDFGETAVMQTIDILNKNGIATVGAGKNLSEAAKPLFLEKKGFKIGIINIAEHEFGTAGKNKAGCAPLEPLDNLKVISDTANLTDITLVVVHGGNEYNPVPSPRMVKTYRAFVEAGAAAVVNIHTHCPQGIELWKGAPIIYCPGNFFFPSIWQKFNVHNFWWIGYLPILRFDCDGAFAVEIVPYSFSPSPPYKIKPFTGKKKDEFLTYLASISNIITDSELTKKYFDAWCALVGPDQLASTRMCAAFWPDDCIYHDASEQLLTLRNHFTCEAHYEVKNNFLRMIEESSVQNAKKFIPELKQLKQANFSE